MIEKYADGIDTVKKIEIAALGFSESAKNKLKKNGSKINSIKEFLKDNKNLEGIKLI